MENRKFGSNLSAAWRLPSTQAGARSPGTPLAALGRWGAFRTAAWSPLAVPGLWFRGAGGKCTVADFESASGFLHALCNLYCGKETYKYMHGRLS